MRTQAIIATMILSVNTIFAEGQDGLYNHHVKIGLNDLSYEYLAKKDIHMQTTVHYNFINDYYGVSFTGGYSFAPADNKTLSLAVGGAVYHQHRKTDSWPLISLKFREELSTLISVGFNVNTLIGCDNHKATSFTFEAPFTWHLGDARAYDLEFKPFVGIGRIYSRSHQYNGFDIHLGRSF